MIFDMACKMAEKCYPPLRTILRQAALFRFDFAPHEVLGSVRDMEVDERDWWHDNFALPFPVTALEDKASLIVLADREDNVVGAEHPRMFVEVMPMLKVDRSAFEHPEDVPDGPSSLPLDTLCAIIGSVQIKGVGADGNFQYLVSMSGYVVTADGKVLDSRFGDQLTSSESVRENMDHAIRATAKNVRCAFEEVMFLNSPDRYVVESSRVPGGRERKPKSAAAKKHIPRSHERPTYTLLRPREIRKVLGMPEHDGEERNSPTPHWRRRHFRRLTADRFTTKKGKVVVVKQAWIGPTEAVVGNRKYRVVVDR